MGTFLTKAPFASVVRLNWLPTCAPVLTSTTDTLTCSLAGSPLPVTTSSVQISQVRTSASAAVAAGAARQGEEPDQHQQELGERLATHQGDACLRQAWLAMV